MGSDATSRPDPDPESIARRIAERRTQLGLTLEQLARDAGMSPHYLEVLTGAGPAFDQGAFLRLAAVLGLTHRELLEGRTDRPPGQSGPPSRPALLRLTEAECWDRVGVRGVGRLAIPAEPTPLVFPVNYAVDAGTLVYRTDPNGAGALPTGAPLSFQVDRIDDHLSTGWSVLITGTAEPITEEEEQQRLRRELGVEPWAGGHRVLWIRIRPDTVSGRRITSLPTLGD
ncbi:pyridoxamine 5'-phosphate oxidase family protein [Kitasatospora paracochleata]|uniref:HTH cro/C1-type domain-containing protein n=1 Tax=Kitasatospora paracochleata TaxID=58354 RepID=A0ABT1JA85_9ACTN|nr:pyridoxamine 5'-phosphate oxidase family protein [Kitasatospora paracochleata]MCP2313586.1 hypothetical protein [Kitasatospora paracochleata]